MTNQIYVNFTYHYYHLRKRHSRLNNNNYKKKKSCPKRDHAGKSDNEFENGGGTVFRINALNCVLEVWLPVMDRFAFVKVTPAGNALMYCVNQTTENAFLGYISALGGS